MTPRLTARVGVTRVLLFGMLLLVVGQALRAFSTSLVIFALTSTLALGGIAVGNILLPVLVKRYFPDRVGLVTGLYTMTMIIGTSAAAAIAVPVAHAVGTWRAGIGVWALLAVAGVVPWLVLARTRDVPAPPSARAEPAVRPWRTSVGWALGLFFGAQAFSGYAIMGWLPQLYRDAGFSPAAAGALLGGMMALGIPLALIMPTMAVRRSAQRGLIALLAGSLLVAYVGLAVAPHAGAIVWTILLALGQASFPLVLAMIGLRARTPAGMVALSAFAQSTGYLIAAFGPLTVGMLYDLTGGWLAPLGVLGGVLLVQLVAGLVAARPRVLEDASPRSAGESAIIGRHESPCSSRRR